MGNRDFKAQRHEVKLIKDTDEYKYVAKDNDSRTCNLAQPAHYQQHPDLRLYCQFRVQNPPPPSSVTRCTTLKRFLSLLAPQELKAVPWSAHSSLQRQRSVSVALPEIQDLRQLKH